LEPQRALGDDVVDTSQPDWSGVRRLTNKRGADVVIEHVGAGGTGPEVAPARRALGDLRGDQRHRGEIDLRAVRQAASLLGPT
jgi:threonine dehydrogenase-like Zn-dependent dehydrogenase